VFLQKKEVDNTNLLQEEEQYTYISIFFLAAEIHFAYPWMRFKMCCLGSSLKEKRRETVLGQVDLTFSRRKGIPCFYFGHCNN
jgi:hypothetical protein